MKRLIKILIFLIFATSSFGQIKYRLLRKNPASVRVSELSKNSVTLCIYKSRRYQIAAIDGKVVWWELTKGTQVENFIEDVEDAHEEITANAHSDITSSGANIEDAVSKRHTQNTDTVLMVNTSDTLICGGNLQDTLTVDNLILIDDRDISVDGAKLDGIEANADVTDSANVSDALNLIPVNAHVDITSAGTDIEDAVSKKHDRKHDIDGTDDHNGVSGATEDNFVSFDANGLPKDSGKSDSDYEDAGAVSTHESSYDHSKLHDRSHAIDSSSDHTSTITENNLMDADANGLPDDSGLSVSDASDAITKKHTQNSDTQLDNGVVNVDASDNTQIGDGGTTNYAQFAADGELSLHGTARIYQTIWLGANELRENSTMAATLSNWGNGKGWSFADGADKAIRANIGIPENMDTSADATVVLFWATNNISDDVQWVVTHLARTENEDTSIAGSSSSSTKTSSSTSKGLNIDTWTISASDIGATDYYITLDVMRDGDHASDTCTSDAYVIMIGFKYVANSLGEAL